MTYQPSLFTQTRIRPPARTDVVSLITWNVQHASAARARRQIDWLTALDDADIVVLTEVPASGDAHAALLADHGYTVLCPAPTGDYRTLLATRVGTLTAADHLYTGAYPGRLVTASIALSGRVALAIAGLYVPSRGPKAHRNVAKRAFQTEIATLLPHLRSAFTGLPVLIAGDLNVLEPGHQPHHSVFGVWEYDFYRAFTDAGFSDGFRHRHPDADEHSWFGRAGLGYRFDHLFCTTHDLPGLLHCNYLHAPRTQALSDHSALAATLRLPLAS
ncbi:endonuclease/exonuclease/phosphatase family protein [Micromonospora sp. NPDC003241]